MKYKFKLLSSEHHNNLQNNFIFTLSFHITNERSHQNSVLRD